MIKKRLCILLCVFMVFPLTGCWNYRSLNEMIIVEGIGIDRDEKTGSYQLSFETVDLSTPVKTKGPQAKIVESEGKTIFEAVRNAKKRLNNKLYFGNVSTVVVSNAIASGQGMLSITDWFLRDAECRENVNVVISMQKTAKEIFSSTGIDQPIVSQNIKNITDEDESVTGSTRDIELYRMYNILKGQGQELVLPAFHVIMNDGKPSVESNGIAVFKKDKLLGYLGPEDSKYFLFATGKIQGGIFPMSTTGSGPENATLEISSNSTKRSFSFDGKKIAFTVKTDTKVILAEITESTNLKDEKLVKKLEKAAEDQLKHHIANVIKKVQSDFSSDIFGFGSIIYKEDLKLWKQLRENWDELFKAMEVTVEPKVHIVNSASSLTS